MNLGPLCLSKKRKKCVNLGDVDISFQTFDIFEIPKNKIGEFWTTGANAKLKISQTLKITNCKRAKMFDELQLKF